MVEINRKQFNKDMGQYLNGRFGKQDESSGISTHIRKLVNGIRKVKKTEYVAHDKIEHLDSDMSEASEEGKVREKDDEQVDGPEIENVYAQSKESSLKAFFRKVGMLKFFSEEERVKEELKEYEAEQEDVSEENRMQEAVRIAQDIISSLDKDYLQKHNLKEKTEKFKKLVS